MDYKDAINNIGSLTSVNSAQSLAIFNAATERMKESQRLEELAKIDRQNAPILKGLRSIIEETQKQNRILQQQIELLKEENERQKKEVEIARDQEQKALKEVKRATCRFWVTTVISTIAVTVSIVFGVLTLI